MALESFENTKKSARPFISILVMSCDNLQGGDPNHQTSDFAVHLTLEHRSAPSAGGGGGSGGLVGAGFRGSSRGGGGGGGPGDLMSFLDEPGGGGGGEGRALERSGGIRGPAGLRRVGRGGLGSGGVTKPFLWTFFSASKWIYIHVLLLFWSKVKLCVFLLTILTTNNAFDSCTF